jgi:hypothetical protein
LPRDDDQNVMPLPDLSSSIDIFKLSIMATFHRLSGKPSFAQAIRVYLQKTPCEDIPECKPFRLLDLPKEIRLMIYERPEIKWTRYTMPISIYGYRGALINASLTGIRILATCQFISTEAGSILRPRLSEMLETPPTMIVRADNLVAFAKLYDPFENHRTMLHRIIAKVNEPATLKCINKYREGTTTIIKVRAALNLDATYSNDSVRAIASFILRLAKFITMDFNTPNDYPPIAVVIQLPSWYSVTTFTYTTPPFIQFWYKHIVRTPQPASFTRQYTLSFIVEHFVYRAYRWFLKYKNNAVSLTVMLQFTDPIHKYDSIAMHEVNLKFAVNVGVGWTAGAGQQKLISYGGLYKGLS